MLELVGLGSNVEAARAAAAETGGTVEVLHAGEGDNRPYSTMVRSATDNVESVAAAADVGLYACFARIIKPEPDPLPTERVTAAFAMVSHPERTHRQADDHWRDIHAPLALASHHAMCDYTQLSVVATLSGEPLDGIALCAFPTRQDLSERFFNDADAQAAVGADVAQFADLQRSWRRVVLVRSDAP